jgi:hypothetical protein
MGKPIGKLHLQKVLDILEKFFPVETFGFSYLGLIE